MVAVQVALALTALVGVAALAIDGGLLLAERRRVQAAADAAALAGAIDLFKNYATYSGTDAQGTARGGAESMARLNYADDPSHLTTTIHIPPSGALTSFYNGKPGYVEVDLSYAHARGLSAIWGSSRIAVAGHAIARGQWAPPDFAILTLDPYGGAEFNVSGGGKVVAAGGTIQVNSNSDSAIKNSGNGSVTAKSINVVGGYTNGGSYSPSPTTGATAIEDPLKSLPAPTPPAPGVITKVSLGSGKYQYTFTPGSYNGNGGPSLPNLGSGDVAIFKQASTNLAGGIYYLYGGLSSTGANLMMDPATTGGILLYNAGTGSSQGLSITGNSSGTVNLRGLDGSVASTRAYQGILYFQARGSTQDISVAGNGSFTMRGTFYAPDASLKITGNTSTPAPIIGSQYIAKFLTVSGGGTVQIDYISGLLAPIRSIMLVE